MQRNVMVFVNVCMYVCMYVRTYVRTYVHIHICVYIYTRILYIYMIPPYVPTKFACLSVLAVFLDTFE